MKRRESQRRAEARYDAKRRHLPHFGGKCSPEQKKLLSRLSIENEVSEKEMIFTALRFYDENHV